MKHEHSLIELAYKYELPLVATNDVCFLEPEMQNAHEVLMCIEAGLTISNPDRKVITPNHYFKNMNEMIDLFNDIPSIGVDLPYITDITAFLIKDLSISSLKSL